MSEPKLSPGPWTVAPGVQVWSAPLSESSHPVLLADLRNSPVSDAEQDANARCMAAAWTMARELDSAALALEEAANVLAGTTFPRFANIIRGHAERARAALALAKGDE